MERSRYFHSVLLSLYSEGDIEGARDLFEANPHGVRQHLTHLVHWQLLPEHWMRTVCASPVSRSALVDRLGCRIPISTS